MSDPLEAMWKERDTNCYHTVHDGAVSHGRSGV